MGSEKKPEQQTLDLFGPRPTPVEGTPAPLPPPPSRAALQQDGAGGSAGVAAALQQTDAIPSSQPAAAERPPAPAPPLPRVASQQATPAEGPRTYRVSELIRLASRALEARFADVWVEGEVSNLKVPGHCYFTLKDADGQLPAVMFRSAAARLAFRLSDGLKVRVRGRLSIYDVQGKLQLYVDLVEPAGLGALQLAFEQLKQKLAAEGLFDESRKRPLPFLPRRIGVATSASGAAVRDVIRVAQRRGPARILIAPCLVQGEGAPLDIVRALAALQRVPDVDLIIVGRGGGSVEDLAAFNDEAVARAIAACRVPVISAVGHEVDVTIADFVADRRAATPSQAAELAVPVHAELRQRLDHLGLQLARVGRRTVSDARLRLDQEIGRAGLLLHRNIGERRRLLRSLEGRLRLLHPRARLARDRAALDGLRRRLDRTLPDRIASGRRSVHDLGPRLHAALHQQLKARHRLLENLAGKLDALSPLKVLDRGFALVRDGSGRVVTRPSQLAPGERIAVRFARGAASARVESVDEDPEE